MSKRIRLWLFGATFFGVVAAATFVVVRVLIDGGSGATAQPVDPDWWVSALQADAQKPALEQQTINGILVGPDSALAPGSGMCEEVGLPSEYVGFGELEASWAGTPLAITPSLPVGVVLTSGEGSRCGGTLVIAAAYYEVAPKDNPADKRFPLWAGGSFSISRRLTQKDQFPLLGAADRVTSLTIAGYPAVAMAPVKPLGVDAGIGPASIVIADQGGITSIEGSGLPFSEFINLAESLYKGPR